MTTLTDRERELVEAARNIMGHNHQYGSAKFHAVNARLDRALRAYDHPKVKKYTMPSWEEFLKSGKYPTGTSTAGAGTCFEFAFVGKTDVYENSYNAIREALATEE